MSSSISTNDYEKIETGIFPIPKTPEDSDTHTSDLNLNEELSQSRHRKRLPRGNVTDETAAASSLPQDRSSNDKSQACPIQTEHEFQQLLDRQQGTVTNRLKRLIRCVLDAFVWVCICIRNLTVNKMKRSKSSNNQGGTHQEAGDESDNKSRIELPGFGIGGKHKYKQVKSDDPELGTGLLMDDDENDPIRHLQDSLLHNASNVESNDYIDHDLQYNHIMDMPSSITSPAAKSKPIPPILTPMMMQSLIDLGLPASVGLKKWKRLYSLQRDGDAFSTFCNAVKGEKHTVICVRTMKHGEILGGFADTEWQMQNGGAFENVHYYGTGQSFLFSIGNNSTNNATEHPQNQQQDAKSSSAKVSIYKWTGHNNYNQLCDQGQTMLAMGGGGLDANFGLCVQDYFRKGSTGPCDTYGNPTLCSEEFFDILDFEVYGFINAW